MDETFSARVVGVRLRSKVEEALRLDGWERAEGGGQRVDTQPPRGPKLATSCSK